MKTLITILSIVLILTCLASTSLQAELYIYDDVKKEDAPTIYAFEIEYVGTVNDRIGFKLYYTLNEEDEFDQSQKYVFFFDGVLAPKSTRKALGSTYRQELYYPRFDELEQLLKELCNEMNAAFWSEKDKLGINIVRKVEDEFKQDYVAITINGKNILDKYIQKSKGMLIKATPMDMLNRDIMLKQLLRDPNTGMNGWAFAFSAFAISR